MKSILIVLNLLLAAAVVWNGLRLFGNVLKENPKTAFTVKKRKPAAAPGTSVKKTESAASAPAVMTGAEKVKLIVEQNIFNQDRCPNTMFGGNTRVELTLVGTFRAGSMVGAVILQKSSSRNQFPFFGMMNPNGNGQPGPRRMGIGPVAGNPQEQAGNRRQRGGAQSIQANRNAQGAVQPGATGTANQPQTAFKQYVRLGETLANGYKLVEVERSRVVLTRGSDKLELELADASKNAPQSGRGRRSNVNQTQIMQQMLRSMQNMQRMQMMQNFEMMRMNRQNQQNQPGGRGGTAPRGR